MKTITIIQEPLLNVTNIRTISQLVCSWTPPFYGRLHGDAVAARMASMTMGNLNRLLLQTS